MKHTKALMKSKFVKPRTHTKRSTKMKHGGVKFAEHHRELYKRLREERFKDQKRMEKMREILDKEEEFTPSVKVAGWRVLVLAGFGLASIMERLTHIIGYVISNL